MIRYGPSWKGERARLYYLFLNIFSRDFGAAEIDVFITEFGLDIKEWNDEKESDAEEIVDCDDVNIEMGGEEQPEDARPLSGKQVRSSWKLLVKVNQARQQRAERIRMALEDEKKETFEEDIGQFEGWLIWFTLVDQSPQVVEAGGQDWAFQWDDQLQDG